MPYAVHVFLGDDLTAVAPSGDQMPLFDSIGDADWYAGQLIEAFYADGHDTVTATVVSCDSAADENPVVVHDLTAAHLHEEVPAA